MIRSNKSIGFFCTCFFHFQPVLNLQIHQSQIHNHYHLVRDHFFGSKRQWWWWVVSVYCMLSVYWLQRAFSLLHFVIVCNYHALSHFAVVSSSSSLSQPNVLTNTAVSSFIFIHELFDVPIWPSYVTSK